jgi:glycosyltransferase involved in cell wall biosynthesis
LPLLKLAHPKGTALLRFLRERRSQILLQRGAAELTGLAGAACRLARIPFVFMLSSDLDLEQGREIMPHPQDRLLYAAGLRAADCVVAQTRDQARRLRRLGGREAVVLRSFPSVAGGLPAAEPAAGRAILWGGNLRPVKRPEWLLSLARRFAGEHFIAFGGAASGHEAYADRIAASFRATPNIEYLGPVALDALPGIFARAGIFLNCSEQEGFPNTFLLAWQHGLSVLATVDPDGLLREGGLGVYARGEAELAAGLAALLTEDDSSRRQRQLAAKRYLLENHDPDRLGEAWERLLRSLA